MELVCNFYIDKNWSANCPIQNIVLTHAELDETNAYSKT